MSGICGICEPGSELSTRSVGPMLDALALPGEIERATHGGISISLGVVRRWGFQQAAVVDHVSVAADADLMDFAELAAALSISPVAAASIPVADLFARLYLQHGAEFVKLLHGAYAFALWDAKTNRLLLSIDPFGVKSLYWRREDARLLFASRVGALRAAQCSPVEVDPVAVLQFLLFSAVPAPLAIDKGTEKLRPGVVLTYETGRVTERQYWDLKYAESTDTSVSRWAQELREELRGSVHRNLEGCEQASTGCYLSGGTDSSSVLAFASEKYQPAHSFSIAFEES